MGTDPGAIALEVFGQFFEEMQGRPMDREEESIMREMFKEGIE